MELWSNVRAIWFHTFLPSNILKMAIKLMTGTVDHHHKKGQHLWNYSSLLYLFSNSYTNVNCIHSHFDKLHILLLLPWRCLWCCYSALADPGAPAEWQSSQRYWHSLQWWCPAGRCGWALPHTATATTEKGRWFPSILNLSLYELN